MADRRWLRQILVNLVDTAIAHTEEGGICISSSFSPISNSVLIWLDVPNHALPTSEPIDLMKSENTVQENDAFSPGMKLLLNQTLLEVMGGKLEIIPYPTTKKADEQLTRVQVSIPLAIAEVEFLQQVGN